jgi:hypothetical protein
LNFGHNIWDKFQVILGTSWGTFCEFDGNHMTPRKFFRKSLPSFPPQPEKEKNWMFHECMVNFLTGYMQLVFPKLFITIFWLKVMVGAHIIGQFNVLDILICQSYQIDCNF